MTIFSKSGICACIAVISLLSGCAIGPDYVRPQIDLPGQYIEQAVNRGEVANIPWWELFKDPVLQDLIRTAIAENKDLKIAISRVDAARALLGETRADQLPRIDGSGGALRTDASDEILFFDTKPRNDFGLFADLSFELDIWGKLRRATAAQRAQLLASEYGQRAVTVILVSEVAKAYFTILGSDDRLAISRQTLKNRQGSTQLIRTRFEKGIIPELDVNQAQIEEADAAIASTSSEREIRLAENSLSILLGHAPSIIKRGQSLDRQILAADIPSGFPAALLEKRPDLLAVEQEAKAAVERIGVAKAEQLPAFSLLGFVGLQSRETGDLFNREAFTWNIGGNFLGPLLDWGKSASKVDFAQATADGLMYQYEQAVLVAVREVEDALTAIRTYRAEREQRGLQVKAALNAAKLSRARYDDGVTSYLEVLDVERSLFSAQLGESESLENYNRAIVQLYKALGGGWTQEEVKS